MSDKKSLFTCNEDSFSMGCCVATTMILTVTAEEASSLKSQLSPHELVAIALFVAKRMGAQRLYIVGGQMNVSGGKPILPKDVDTLIRDEIRQFILNKKRTPNLNSILNEWDLPFQVNI